jgi:uncharacterized protein YqeY
MLKEKINNDIKEALKSGNRAKRLVLSLLQSAIKNRELQKRVKTGKEETLNDEEIIEVIVSEVKKRKESIENYERGGREELAQKEKEELNVLMEYMPEQMSESRLREEVKRMINEIGAKDIKEIGKVLGVLMPKLKGKADGQIISRIVKEELGG